MFAYERKLSRGDAVSQRQLDLLMAQLQAEAGDTYQEPDAVRQLGTYWCRYRGENKAPQLQIEAASVADQPRICITIYNPTGAQLANVWRFLAEPEPWHVAPQPQLDGAQ